MRIPMSPRFISMRLPALLLIASLAACGNDEGPRGPGSFAGKPGAAGNSGLPSPDAAPGSRTDSITGMPEGGAGSPLIIETPAELAEPVNDDAGIANAESIDGNAVLPPATAHTEPGADEAVKLIRDYYSAINQRQYPRAYQLWQGAGAASGQTVEQFERGFADSGNVSIQIGQPGPIDAGAGQRHIEVPVTINARHADGRETRYMGSYFLQRSVVDGASAAQSSWRISRASLQHLQ